MAQFGFGALVKTAVLSAVATSGVWLVAGLNYYDREWGKPAVGVDAAGDPVPVSEYLPTAPAVPAPVASASAAPATPVLAAPGQAATLQSPAPGSLQMPVVGVKVSALVDTFSASRSGGRLHDAIDIMAPRGTPVVAAAAGKIEKLFTSKAGGITVYVRSPDRRVIYYYAHLDSYAPGLAEGQDLAAGAPIGFVGFTGNASPDAPHLHFAILATTPEANWYEPATAVNPYPLLTGPR